MTRGRPRRRPRTPRPSPRRRAASPSCARSASAAPAIARASTPRTRRGRGRSRGRSPRARQQPPGPLVVSLVPRRRRRVWIDGTTSATREPAIGHPPGRAVAATRTSPPGTPGGVWGATPLAKRVRAAAISRVARACRKSAAGFGPKRQGVLIRLDCGRRGWCGRVAAAFDGGRGAGVWRLPAAEGGSALGVVGRAGHTLTFRRHDEHVHPEQEPGEARRRRPF